MAKKTNGKSNLSLKAKLALAFSVMAVLMITSSLITILEYRRMSSYVSDLMAGNIKSINVAASLAKACDEYNLKILSEIGGSDEKSNVSFDMHSIIARCDSLNAELESVDIIYVDTVLCSYEKYKLVTMELPEVMESHFIDGKDWYFGRLQPEYDNFRADINYLIGIAYSQLQSNSVNFEDGFQRSMIPGAISVGTCVVLLMLLLFYIIIYYVRPLGRMNSNLEAYNSGRVKKYSVKFEGDDEIFKLNSGISDIVEENSELKKRLSALKNKADQ